MIEAGGPANSQQVLPQVPERFEILQAVRAIAALGVLLHHAGHAADKYGGPMPLIELTGMGRAGVDLFFVLSGFIILHATVGRGLTWKAFAHARFRRIYLPYWPAGLVMAVIIFGSASTDSTILRNLIASVTLLPVGEPMLNVAWTLQHEVMFTHASPSASTPVGGGLDWRCGSLRSCCLGSPASLHRSGCSLSIPSF